MKWRRRIPVVGAGLVTTGLITLLMAGNPKEVEASQCYYGSAEICLTTQTCVTKLVFWSVCKKNWFYVTPWPF